MGADHAKNVLNKKRPATKPVSSSITVLLNDQNGFKTHLTPKETITLFLSGYNNFRSTYFDKLLYLLEEKYLWLIVYT